MDKIPLVVVMLIITVFVSLLLVFVVSGVIGLFQAL